MPRTASPAVRAALVERAAEMLARREPVTLRALVEGTGASTMAVYTHFGGMPGLWRAVRQEGFTRLAARLATVPRTEDPVRDLAALGAAYVANALAGPALYRAMFDAAADLEDPAAADASFQSLVESAARARREGRFAADSDPEAVATRVWAAGHGLAMLVLTGPLPAEALDAHAPAMVAALCVAAGDDPERAGRSVRAGWSPPAR
ncbi:TetR/AcrR family transcriptional regulator [Geodermatophilus sp. SYSU D00697]